MVMKKILFLLLFLSGCGPHKVEVEQKTPITVEHVVKIDEKQLAKYFEIICLEENPNYTDSELQDCIDNEIAKFLNIVNGD
jgi:hypothetical protein